MTEFAARVSTGAASEAKGAFCPDAIVAEHLTKVFRTRHEHHTLKRAMTNLLRRRTVEQATVLNDISFRVPHGETLAVIGRNGSGKSTLLGLLAQVYRPTSGELTMVNAQGERPRIAPLLELGAGLHPELNSFDNIEFYGAILGMTAAQVRERTDRIIEFAELQSKADTIARDWNDGAKLRLGFSIAVHADLDILLVDEVLAVGDEAFQNKCYRRIAQLQAAGKTIVFVSHDLPVVERVARRVLWLNNGVLQMDGDVETVMRAYRKSSEESANDSADESA